MKIFKLCCEVDGIFLKQSEEGFKGNATIEGQIIAAKYI